MNYSELCAFLQTHSLAPLKHLSQNFLIDPNITAKICRAAHIQPGEQLLEIGPGPGALTRALLAQGARLVAIEKDRGFAEHLTRFQTADQRLTILCQDALEDPFPPFQERIKIVANLPYHITAPLLLKFCHHFALFSSAFLMVQKEVAERLLSQEQSLLSLHLQLYASISRQFLVSKECFYPKPSVDSAIIRLDFQPPPRIEIEPFLCLIRTAFQQKRKMIQSSLRHHFHPDILRQALQALGLRSDARPATLSLHAWLALFQELQKTL